MDAFSQTTFSNAFSLMKIHEFRLRFHWSLFVRFELTIFQHWFRKWLGAGQATNHYLNQWWLVYWRIYASLGLNELIRPSPGHHCACRWPVTWWCYDISRHRDDCKFTFDSFNPFKISIDDFSHVFINNLPFSKWPTRCSAILWHVKGYICYIASSSVLLGH